MVRQFYNAKYPKLNITFPRYELDVKSFKDNPSTAFSIYHSDVRSILNTKNFRLPIFKGEADDEIALKVLRWAMNPELAGLAPATASLEEKMKAGALVYLCDEHTTAWNQHNIDEIEDRLWKAIWDGDVVEVVSLLSRRNEIINEYWSYSYQTFIRGYGDCEDGAILMYDVIKNARENDLFLGMTSQCIDGTVRMTVYESGRDLLDLGITPLENMTPETSLVKAMWALGNSKDADEMKSLMLENIASEF